MRVVIIGGGFGGVRAALDLAGQTDFDVTLVSKQSFFEYHAALYRSATGRSPLEVAIPLADFFAKDANVDVVKDEIVGIDVQAKTVTGKSDANYHYDAVIFAIGAVTQYFGIKGLPEYSYGVKTINEALELKRRLHEDLLSAQGGERNYVVIGGGPTGIELAGELMSYLKYVRQRHGITAAFKVDLVEAHQHLLPELPDHFSATIAQRLRKLGVNVYLGALVESESVDQIKLPHGEIQSHTVVWTAGTSNNPFFAANPQVFEQTGGGKVTVNEYLEAKPAVFVIGDSAATEYSGMAQTAIYDANFVTANLKRTMKLRERWPYRPKRPVYAIPAGPNWSAVLWGQTKIYGRLGWLIRRLADLRLYISFLPPNKALSAWRYGFRLEESCPTCL